METHQIPGRETSRYARQYAGVSDSRRLVEIFTDSQAIALSSKNPDTARARFDLAVEAYHQLMSLRISGDERASIHGAMSMLASAFPAQVVVNEALGLCDKAAKLKTARKKLGLLQRARDVLGRGVATDPGGSAAIQGAAEQVRVEIAKVEDGAT